jgi:hypothetical protein
MRPNGIMSHTKLSLIPWLLGVCLFAGAVKAQENLLLEIDPTERTIAGDWTRVGDDLRVTAGSASRIVLAKDVPG